MAQPGCTLSPPASIHEDPARGLPDALALECTLSPPPSLHQVPIETPKGKATTKPTVTFDLTPPDQAPHKPQQPTHVQPPSSWPEKVVPETHAQPHGGVNPPNSTGGPGSFSESINSAKLIARKSFDKSTTYARKQVHGLKDKPNNDEKSNPKNTSPAPVATKPLETPVHDSRPPNTKPFLNQPAAGNGPESAPEGQPPLRQRIKDAHNQRKERRTNMSPSEKLKDIAEGILIGCGVGAVVFLICAPCGLLL